MKKYRSMLFAAVMAVCCLSACGQKNSNIQNSNIPTEKNEEKQLKVVTTIFPVYDWVREMAGDESSHIELTMLLDNGVDLHSYQPTAEDMMKISDCDLFIYVGGESDEWVDDALKEAANEDMKVISLLDVLGASAKTEEVIEGMQQQHEHDHDDEQEAEGEEEHEREHEHEEEVDEHVWLSLQNAKMFCRTIADELSVIDSENADAYEQNVKAYEEKLDALDAEYREAVKAASQRTLLFADRFPFRYFVDDYGLDYYAAFAGCSAETEAAFETITFLAQKADELELKTVLTIEKSDGKMAKTVIDNTKDKNQTVLQMDSMQSVTSKDAANGITYLSIMENNLNVLKEALR